MTVPDSQAEVLAKGVGGAGTERDSSASAALAGDDGNREIPIEVGDVEAGHFAEAHPGVDEEADEGGVSAFLEPGTLAGIDETALVGFAEQGHGLLGDLGWSHLGHRAGGELVDVDQ